MAAKPNREKDFFLSTSDNPYNYFTDFDHWYKFDESHGYCTCGLVARITPDFDYLPDEIMDDIMEDSIEHWLSIAIPFINKDGKRVKYIKCIDPDS